MSKLIVHIENWDSVAARVIDVWERSEQGEEIAPSYHVSFASWEALAATPLTPALSQPRALRAIHLNAG